MGHRAYGAVPKRARLGSFVALVGILCTFAGIGGSRNPAHGASLPALTIYASRGTVRASLRLQPGFALIIRTDRQIDTVAIGDPRIVSAAPVHRGTDVFDVVLQPQSDAGKTNMVIWLNDVTTIWDLEVGHNPRTADVVFVVTQPRTTQKALNLPEAGGGAAANLPPANDEGPGVFREPRHVPQDAVPTVTKPNLPQPERDSSNSRSTVDTAPPSAIELQQVVGEVKAAFRAIRTKTGVMVRYEITNGSDADLAVRPKAVLIRADGRILAYGILRKSVDPGRLGIIPRGATETGTIDIATATGRTIELIIPLAPLASPIAAPPAAGQAPSQPRPRRDAAQTARAPFVLQATFNGMDRLPITTLP